MPSNRRQRQVKKYEIDLFNAIADLGDFDLTTQKQHRLITRLLRSNNISLKGMVLEAGCGSGNTGKHFLKIFPKIKVLGVDISPKMVDRANDGTSSYKAIVGDLENKNLLEANSVDAVICFLVLHHFPSLSKIFKNFSVWLKDGGYIVIVEPNGENVIGRISHQLRVWFEILLGRELLVQTKMATPNETNHTLGYYQKYLAKNNFKIINQGYFYDEPNLSIGFSLGGLRLWFSRVLHNLFKGSRIVHTSLIVLAKK